MARKPIFVAAAVVALSAGCIQGDSPLARMQDKAIEARVANQPAGTMALVGAPGLAGGEAVASPRVAQDLQMAAMDRKLIRNGRVELEVEDAERAIAQIDSLAIALGGFVGDAQVTEDASGHHRGSITVRIPEPDFESAVSALSVLGKVKSHQVSSEDVSKAYYDLETRLAVTRETAARLRELLASQTGKLSEVLQVERELSRVIGTIEMLEGERRYYDNLIALATVTITLYEPEAIVKAGALDPIRVAFRNAVGIFIVSVATMVQVTVVLLPWGLLALTVWLVARKTGLVSKLRQE